MTNAHGAALWGRVTDILLGHITDDFGVELAHNFAASHDNGFDGTFQVSIHYLDGFSDPDFFEHVWGRA